MIFQTATAERVFSTSQRALLMYWQRLAGQRPYPAPAEFNPAGRIHDPRQLVIWQVERDGPGRRFRAVHHGAHVAEVFGGSWAGRTMDEVVPPFALPFAKHPPTPARCRAAPSTPSSAPATRRCAPSTASACCCRSGKAARSSESSPRCS